MRPLDFRMYVHDVRLIDASGNAVAVQLDNDGVWQRDGLALLDFEDGTGACETGSPATRFEVVGKAPRGTYHGVSFVLGVPKAMQSCHTALIDGYVVEGHVPTDAINRLLAERPKVTGVAAPGMPSGSPGMEMGEAEVFTLYLFDAASSREFGKWRGSKPV
jgi:hypothetical protein